MPLDDYRRQIDASTRVDLDMISHCAYRYRVSLLAAILRWLTYTARRAILVVTRDGFEDRDCYMPLELEVEPDTYDRFIGDR